MKFHEAKDCGIPFVLLLVSSLVILLQMFVMCSSMDGHNFGNSEGLGSDKGQAKLEFSEGCGGGSN